MWHVGFQRALPLFQRLLGGACYLPLFQGLLCCFLPLFQRFLGFLFFPLFQRLLGVACFLPLFQRLLGVACYLPLFQRLLCCFLPLFQRLGCLFFFFSLGLSGLPFFWCFQGPSHLSGPGCLSLSFEPTCFVVGLPPCGVF